MLSAAEHWWNFDETTSLYNIIDKVSKTRASIREGGAKLTRHELSTNNYLTLEGRGSSIELGRFGKCIGDLATCSSGFTFSLWLRVRDTVGESQYILGNKDISSSGQGFSLLRTKQNEMKFMLKDSRGEMQLTYSSPSGQWSHHVVAWNGRQFSAYVNGRKLLMEGSKQSSGHYFLGREGHGNNLRKKRSMETDLLSLGRHGFKIDADYDDIMFWNRNLNGTEASVVYYRDLG